MGRLGISLSEHNRREAMFARKLGDLGYMVRIGRYGRWATLVPQVSHLAFNYGHPRKRDGVRVYSRIEALGDGETLDRRLSDYLYDFLAHDPFVGLLREENRARNLATFSQLLNVFQNYYHYTVITARNRQPLRFHFFNSFLRLLHDGGINEYEDPDLPFQPGHVQVMTIHQAKGLEFPVVVVGSLAVQTRTQKDVDRNLGGYYARPPFEPEDRITGFDRMRLHYVAFSRPEKVLVLTSTDHPRDHFDSIWQGLPQWPYVDKEQLARQRSPLRQVGAARRQRGDGRWRRKPISPSLCHRTGRSSWPTTWRHCRAGPMGLWT